MSLDGSCVSSSINATVIKKNALLIHEVRQALQRRQYIYPEMKFSCNGRVTKWIYGTVDQNRSTGILPNLYEYYPVTPLDDIL